MLAHRASAVILLGVREPALRGHISRKRKSGLGQRWA
jgi:hypothetical protein